MSGIASYDRGQTASPDLAAGPPSRWRSVLAGPAVAGLSLLLAAAVVHAAGVPLRDPDRVASERLLVAASYVVALVGLDILVRAVRRSPRWVPSLAVLAAVRRERWTRRRALAVTLAVISFFVTYFAYRNLKSVVPLLRPDHLFDRQLTDLDRLMFAGQDPAFVMHWLLGQDIAAHALSFVYMLLFLFIPVSLSMALVFSPALEPGLFYSTAFALNWLIGAGTYFLLPSIGPFHADPGLFVELPYTAVTHLQDYLLNQRADFLYDPAAAGAAQSIGAFASLHVSIFATAAMAAHLLALHRVLKVVLWTLTALTAASTIYFGWHYVLDVFGGFAIAALALALAWALTGIELRGARLRRTPTPAPEPA